MSLFDLVAFVVLPSLLWGYFGGFIHGASWVVKNADRKLSEFPMVLWLVRLLIDARVLKLKQDEK